jgi:Xaa-Pro aminopeptidase
LVFVADLLIYADTVRSPELRHEVPVPVPDPFLYAERDGSRYAFVGSLEIPRMKDLDGLEAVPFDELGMDELIAQGLSSDELDRQLVLRACRRVGIDGAAVPRTFPLHIADHLRANGVELRPEGETFDLRRRVKTEAELAGIRRAQRAAEQAMDAIRARLRAGGSVTCEELRAEAMLAFTEAGTIIPDIVIVSHGAQTAVGHEPGYGEVQQGEPVIVDLYPQDPESGCYTDMTRTFCVGEPPEELAGYHALVREALDLAYDVLKPGVKGADAHRAVCEFFQGHGFPTQLTKAPGEILDEGFDHSLGHGVGLEVHEQPFLGRMGALELVPGDVVAVEPGLYRPEFGGCRLEDTVLVTDGGVELLGSGYPYDLAP